jgi:DNA-binding NtrC family response regulator
MGYAILIVDDEEPVRTALRRALRGDDYEIHEASSGEEGLDVLRKHAIDVIISDHAMPQMTGLDFLRSARMIRPDSLRIILTGNADVETCVRAINEGAIYRFLQKPWTHVDLRVMIRLAISHLESERRSAGLVATVREQREKIEKLEKELALYAQHQKAAAPEKPAKRMTAQPQAVVVSDDEAEEWGVIPTALKRGATF